MWWMNARGKSSPPAGGGCSSLMARSSDLCFLSLRRWQRWWWWWWWWALSLSWSRVWPEDILGLSRSYSLRLTSRTPLWGVNEDVDRRMGLTSAIGCVVEIKRVNVWKTKNGDEGEDTCLAQSQNTWPVTTDTQHQLSMKTHFHWRATFSPLLRTHARIGEQWNTVTLDANTLLFECCHRIVSYTRTGRLE